MNGKMQRHWKKGFECFVVGWFIVVQFYFIIIMIGVFLCEYCIFWNDVLRCGKGVNVDGWLFV